MSRTTRALAVAGDAHPQRRYQRPADTVYHVPTARMADGLDALVRSAIVREWRNAPARSGRETQVLRDMARSEHRPLGLRAIERGLLALGDKRHAYAIAAAIMAWAEASFGGVRGSLGDAWAREQREDAEADVAVVGALRSASLGDVDTAIAEQNDLIQHALLTKAALITRRDELTRPMGTQHWKDA